MCGTMPLTRLLAMVIHVWTRRCMDLFRRFACTAAKKLGVDPNRAVVVEDAISGVIAGSSGNFGLVIGVDRANQAQKLKEYGADVVVDDLDQVLLTSS